MCIGEGTNEILRTVIAKQLSIVIGSVGPTDGAFIFEGRMVDAPVLRKARRIVELSDRLG